MLKDDEVELAVQVNGRRAKIMVPADADQQRRARVAFALGTRKSRRRWRGSRARKVIVVPGRLVNIITG
ncbi:MAG: hypothetical protein R3B46_08290 [Phycisphaerales bacterium]